MAKCEFCGKDVKFGIKLSLTDLPSVYMLAPVVCVQAR